MTLLASPRLLLALAALCAVLFLAGVAVASLYAPRWVGQLIGLSGLGLLVLCVAAAAAWFKEDAL